MELEFRVLALTNYAPMATTLRGRYVHGRFAATGNAVAKRIFSSRWNDWPEYLL